MSEVGKIYDDMAEGYDAHDDTLQFLAEDRFVYGMINEYLGDRTLVDLGCGTGRAVQWLNPSPSKYYGYDVSTGMLSIAAQKHPEHFFDLADMRDVHTIPNALVISLYGSPCYMPVKDLAMIMTKWNDAGAEQFYLLFGNGRNRQTYGAKHEHSVHPTYFGQKELSVLASAIPPHEVIGVDVYAQNKFLTDVDLWHSCIVSQAKDEARVIEEFAWVMVHIPAKGDK